MTSRTLRLAAALAAPLLFAAPAAFAHAHLHASAPAADTTVAAPNTVHMEFSEKLEPKFSGAELKSAAGAAVNVKAKISGTTMDLTPAKALAAGAYTVTWHVLAGDGHKSNGQFAFTVK